MIESKIEVTLKGEVLKVRVLKRFTLLEQVFKVCKGAGKYMVVWRTKVLLITTDKKSSATIMNRFEEMIIARGYTDETLLETLKNF